MQRYAFRHPRVTDVAGATALIGCSLLGSNVTLPGHALDVSMWPGVLLTGLSCVFLPCRRSHPRTAVVLTTACAMALVALGYIVTMLLLGPLMVALFWLAKHTRRGVAYSFALGSIVLLVATGTLDGAPSEPLLFRTLGPTAWLLLPTALGTASRIYRAFLEEEARRRVGDERMRIARDLHDVVAHHLVLAKLQAGAVARLVGPRPAKAEQLAIELTGTTTMALSELKATVGLLRRAGAPGESAARTPGLAQLHELAATFRSAGLTVAVSEEGVAQPLAAGADLSAYRIVQEALTNVTKHATTTSAAVRLVYLDDRLCISVTNDGSARNAGPSAPSGGYGLIGMRERARAVGGLLRVGSREQGGFEVVAELPLRQGALHEERTAS
ncbi:sensor histidine kinase [Streptomyces sp. NPDC090075]|uniref:sensor histidine kinase n=1 Tax=Streptomyces sp. NPDC090075 TaxID=3365937 RepID=UPI00381D1FDA